jgi:hypothetical protein
MGRGTVFNGKLYYTTYINGGDNRPLFRTDGFTSEFVDDLGEGSVGTYRVGELPFLFILKNDGTTLRYLVTDEISTADFASYFTSPGEGGGLAGRSFQLLRKNYYVGVTGNVYELAVVPEPGLAGLLFGAAVGLITTRRNRLAAK